MRPARSQRALSTVAVLFIAAVLAVVVIGCGATSHTASANAASTATTAASTSGVASPDTAAASLKLGAAGVGPAVPSGFVGLATEYWDVERLTGTNPKNPDVPFEHLLTALSPTGAPSLRVGGDSTDWVWWPLKGEKTPPWVHWSLSSGWTSVVKKFAADTGAKLLLGVNLEADSPTVTDTEVSELASHIGTSHIAAFEIGNEPELYSAFPFYHEGSTEVKGRAAGYAWLKIAPDIAAMTAKIPATGVPIVGPGYAQLNAQPYVGDLLTQAKRVSEVTVHTYPLKSSRCNGGHSLTEAQLFTNASLGGLADGVASFVKAVGKYGAKVRTDEMNSVTCNGEAGFSNTFGPALWTLNILADYAGAGDSGVNFDFEPISAQHLITASDTKAGWQVQVLPTYYGLLAFARAVPAGSRLIPSSTLGPGLLDFAARTPQHTTNAVITNIGAHTRTVKLTEPGVSGPATVSLLTAKGGLTGTSGVTLGGQAISASTGRLSGTAHTPTISPKNGTYTLTVPAGAAAIVSFG